MNLGLFPVAVGVWNLDLGAQFDAELYDALMRVNDDVRTGTEIWDRQSHNIFDGSVPQASCLADAALSVLQREFVGPRGRIAHLQGREVVRQNGVEIMPHTDEDECHLQAVYFPCGAEINPATDLMSQFNKYGPNGFSICNPDWRSSGFGKYLMPWEASPNFWIKPHRGLLVAFDARAVHFQKPYVGDKPFMNILLNIKVERTNG